MRPLIAKIKPAKGFSKWLYIALNVLLPVLAFMFVTWDFVSLAFATILLSKWRMFAVRPRFWPTHIRANAVDIIVGVSLLLFMISSGSLAVRLLWTGLYVVWLVVIKPATSTLVVSGQALVALVSGLMAIFVAWGDLPLGVLVISSGLICYLSAHHFFDSFDEPYARLLSSMWGYFGAAMVWVLAHWLLYYGIIAQPVLLLVAIGCGLATLYYLDHNDKLSQNAQREVVFIMIAIVSIILGHAAIVGLWRDKIV